jgi:hypothetical protein
MSNLKWLLPVLAPVITLGLWAGSCQLKDHDDLQAAKAGLYWHVFGKPVQ